MPPTLMRRASSSRMAPCQCLDSEQVPRPGSRAQGLHPIEEAASVMDYSVEQNPERLLAEARAGRRESLGILLERYRAYLRTLACSKIDLHLQARANPSDLVQETFLLASRHFDQFRGSSEGEWLHWLRRILRRRLIQFVRKH